MTGAHGFIGQELTRILQQNDFIVHRLSRQTADLRNHFAYDLTHEDCPSEMFQGIATVFHLAGKAHDIAGNQQDFAEYRLVNTEGTRKLLEAARQAGVQRFIFFSSVKASAGGENQAVDEAIRSLPDTPYGLSKFEAENLVLQGGYVPHPVVIRPCMVYGNTHRGNLPRMIRAISRGLFPPLPETHNKRSMVHVTDVARAALLAAEKPQAAGHIYIVTDGQTYSTRQIYDWIRGALGKSAIPWALPLGLLKGLARIGDSLGRLIGRRFPFNSIVLEKLTGSAWYSSAKIESELGFKAEFSLQQALPDIVRYLQK